MRVLLNSLVLSLTLFASSFLVQVEKPESVKQGDVAQCKFEALQPFVVDTFKNCEGLGRIAFLDADQPVMIGKVLEVEHGMPEHKNTRYLRIKKKKHDLKKKRKGY